MKNVLHVGIDVDDNAFHAAGFCYETGEILEFACKPTGGALMKKMRKWEESGFSLKSCYEATYLGYSLHHFLVSKGVDNSIIAPSLIPDLPGKRKKTDRIDAKKLASYFARDLLTKIYIPNKKDEVIRDLVRSRFYIVCKLSGLKNHTNAIMRRHGFNYKQEEQAKSYWTDKHISWIKKKSKEMGQEEEINFELLLSQQKHLSEIVEDYNTQIVNIADDEIYKEKKNALCCFRGIDTLSAISLIVEIGDIRRFPNPRKLTAYTGMDIEEYSSGGKENKIHITKMGNPRIRTIAVEACQLLLRKTMTISRRLKKARENQDDKKIVAIAEKCDRRLQKRARQLQRNNKNDNKIKVACGREFLAFIWEALTYLENKKK